MEELIIQLLQEQKQTNELLRYGYQGKNPDELLTAKQISKEYGIAEQKVLYIFKDPKLEVQRWTRPFKVKRKIFNEYLDKNHDYLCK